VPAWLFSITIDASFSLRAHHQVIAGSLLRDSHDEPVTGQGKRMGVTFHQSLTSDLSSFSVTQLLFVIDQFTLSLIRRSNSRCSHDLPGNEIVLTTNATNDNEGV
jgi:hypothetical protein